MATTKDKTALTQASALSAPIATAPYELRDRGSRQSIKGLLLRVQPSGVRTYYVEIARGRREKIGDASNYTLKRARVEAKKLLGKAADGHDFKAERARKRAAKDSTLGAYLDAGFTEYAQANIVSHKDMIGRVRRQFAALLKKPMNEITELDMRRWQKGCEGVTLETIRRSVTYLKAVLNRAVKDKVIPDHQLRGYKPAGTLRDDEGHAKVRYLTADEERRLRAALDAREVRVRADREVINASRRERGAELLPALPADAYADNIKPMVLLALNTGLRRGDLFDLQWQHVDLARRQIRKVIGKTSHARRKAGKRIEPATVPLTTEAQAVLATLHKHRDTQTDLVFPSPVSGTRLDNITKGFANVIKLANIEGFRFHDLRHTFASRLVMAGVDINTVRELMTHSDIKMTLIYAHLSPDHKATALERAFGGAP